MAELRKYEIMKTDTVKSLVEGSDPPEYEYIEKVTSTETYIGDSIQIDEHWVKIFNGPNIVYATVSGPDIKGSAYDPNEAK